MVSQFGDDFRAAFSFNAHQELDRTAFYTAAKTFENITVRDDQ
jgi:hypothetical protein